MLAILTLARDVRRRTSLRALVAASALVAAVVVPSVDAHALAAPSNIQPPTLEAAPAVGSFLAPTPGSWSGSPTSFSYQLLRCPGGGGAADGSNCTMVGPPTPDIRPLELESRDVGYRFRVRVTRPMRPAPQPSFPPPRIRRWSPTSTSPAVRPSIPPG